MHKYSFPPNLKVANFRASNLKVSRLIKFKINATLESIASITSYNILPDWNTPVIKLDSVKHLDISKNCASTVMNDMFTRCCSYSV